MGEFEGGDEAGLLVQAIEVASDTDKVVLFSRGDGQKIQRFCLNGLIFSPNNPI